MEHILFLTGRLAHDNLVGVLSSLEPAPFTWDVRELSLQVAGLMTADMIRRRLAHTDPMPAARIMVPGRCRGDLDALSEHFGIPVVRGPDELKDLPAYFDRAAKPIDLSRHDIRIFAEIVDAPQLTVEQIVARGRQLTADGADVIDLGCLPETPFEHLEASVQALHEAGFKVSVDSLDTRELLRGGRAGADYLLSLTIDTLWIADEVASTPILIPRQPEDEASLYAAIDAMQAKGRAFLADSILDPLPFGLVRSICRYQRLRDRHPDIEIMMGTGNVTELLEADTSGINALLIGMAAELQVRAVLTTQVSSHARRVVREIDVARRILHEARETRSLAKGISDALMTVHDKRPFPDTPQEIDAIARAVRDPSFRVQISSDGLHVYNRDGHQRGTDPFAFFPKLGLEHDGSHAFYMGVELARAEIAWSLGKRYAQDSPLSWGCATEGGSNGAPNACAADRASTPPASTEDDST